MVLLFSALAAQAQTISGTIREADNGPLLRSMVVAAYTPAGILQANTTTDTSGQYDLALPVGQYRVLAYDPTGTHATQFANDAPSFEESPLIAVGTGEIVTLNFALRRGFTITGIVTTSGGVRAGLTVSAYNLSGTRRGFTTTNGAGAYSLVVPAGSYKFVAYDDAGAFAPSFFRDRTSFAEADIVTVGAGGVTPSVDFFLQLGARISGIVTDSAAVPLTNVSVLAYTAAGKFVSFVTTDVDGRFTMTLQPGSYRLVAIDNTFTFAAAFLGGATSFEGSTAITLNAGQVRSGITFRLDIGGLVAGKVVDAATGKGIAGITVAAYNPDGTERTFVTTDANGQYVLLLPSGSFRIAAFDTNLVYATQFYPQQTSFARSTGISATIGQSMTLPPFTLSHGGRVSGTVTDVTSHAPIPGAIVVAYDPTGIAIGEATSLPDGTYRFVLPPDSYRLVASDPALRYAPGYSGQSTNFDHATMITVVTDAETVSDFGLQRGTLVTGSVDGPLHEPAPGVVVTFLDLGGNRVASATAAADGSFQLALLPGSYKILIVDPAGHYAAGYFGGGTLVTATVVAVDATGAPRLTIVVQVFSRRRAVSH